MNPIAAILALLAWLVFGWKVALVLLVGYFLAFFIIGVSRGIGRRDF